MADPPVRLDVGAVRSTQRFESTLGLNVHLRSFYRDGTYVSRSAFDTSGFTVEIQSEAHPR
ncbi:hypothetical protein Poly30_56330 [Planctomycetes bacterium Poly30]|uniref:Uncharacterized protein n=1 Tax=Saltatorellus ferox TaxID=2528018 RepID=A0A518F150_9BACT|nr:hypothetical protein Poly30_56330 [Planctomycetes bacterium Poly30]